MAIEGAGILTPATECSYAQFLEVRKASSLNDQAHIPGDEVYTEFVISRQAKIAERLSEEFNQ